MRNLLYREPELYEAVYPQTDRRNAAMCLRMFSCFLPVPPSQVLDLGCGIGRDLWFLSESCPHCVGVDRSAKMVQYATLRPKGIKPIGTIKFLRGDMRYLRLGQTFDAVLCLGSAFMYCFTNDDLTNTFETFASHCHPGSLLVLDLRNSTALLGRQTGEPVVQEFRTPLLVGRAVVRDVFDRREQLLIRRRTWYLTNKAHVIEDRLVYRMLFPKEIELLLTLSGFVVLGMFDNRELLKSTLDGDNLYVAAEFYGRG